MKKLTIVLAVTALVIGVLSMGAMAFPPSGNSDTVRLTETNDATDDARAYLRGNDSGACNAEIWMVEMSSSLEMAQWIDFNVTSTEWLWYVRKPGDYYTDCITFSISSNGDVVISFQGFSDLEFNSDNALAGVKQTVDTYFGHSRADGTGPLSNQWSGWFRADALNDVAATVPDSLYLHEGLEFKLWNRIVVEDCNSAGVYSTSGTVVITLQNTPDWLDAAGEWVN